MDTAADAEPLQMLIDRRALEGRAQRYSSRCAQWLDRVTDRERSIARERDDPTAVVARLSGLVAAEVAQALTEWADTGPEQQTAHADAYGSAAIALIAIEQSRHAWLALVRDRDVRATVAQPFVSDLVWLKHEIEQAFPGIRFPPARVSGPA